MQFGTPPRSFWMLIDSGSADTWIPSEACTTCGPHQAIGSNSSSTYVSTRQEWNITYGSGSASGLVVRDTVEIAGMQLQNHSFGVTLDVSRMSCQAASGATHSSSGIVAILKLSRAFRRSGWYSFEREWDRIGRGQLADSHAEPFEAGRSDIHGEPAQQRSDRSWHHGICVGPRR